MSELRTQLSRRASSLRQRAGLTQEQVAREAGIGLDAVGRLERGEVTPSLDTLQRLAHVYQIDVSAFFSADDSQSPNPVLDEIDSLAAFLATKPLNEIRFYHRLVRSAAENLNELRRGE